MTPDEDLLLATVRRAHPGATVEPDGGWFWVEAEDGGSLCGSPSAHERRAQRGRCCVGGPCHEPAMGETPYEALCKAVAGMLGGKEWRLVRFTTRQADPIAFPDDEDELDLLVAESAHWAERRAELEAQIAAAAAKEGK